MNNNNVSLGKFYVIEGIDGSGKTVVSRLVSERLNLYLTREPTMKFVLSDDELENLYKFSLDRYIHNRDIIIPKLQEGISVITDRYYLSSICYQSNGKYFTDIESKFIREISVPVNCPIISGWFILHPDINDAVSRCSSRGESENTDRLRHIDINYTIMSMNLSNCYHIMTKDQSIHDIVNTIVSIIKDD